MNDLNPTGAFSSPWQRRGFVRLVALARWVLRPWPGAEDRFIDRLVADQNRRVGDHLRVHPPARVLLIMPRCVKKTGCRAPVQESLNECLVCRQCPLGDVAHLCLEHGIEAMVAFRSHIAFAMARNEQPDLIIASACRDRLVKALCATPEFPALLAPLTGMRKMCLDAGIDLDWLSDQLALAAPGPARDQVRAAEGS